MHEKYFHTGKQFIIHYVKQKFWVISDLYLARKKEVIYHYVLCTRLKIKIMHEVTGLLTSAFTQISSFFTSFVFFHVHLRSPLSIKYTGIKTTTIASTCTSFYLCFYTSTVHKNRFLLAC